jgi:mono/diheme cytochrome c family protein
MRAIEVAHAGLPGQTGIKGRRHQADQGSKETGEIVVPRDARLARGTFGLVAMAAAALAVLPLRPASAQNLEAGKAGAQIFAEVCSGCHRSAHDLRNGASASFLREHYTTGSEMASTMAAYLASAANDPRAAPAPKRTPPVGTPAAAPPAPPPPAPPPQQASVDPKPGTAQTASPPNGRPRLGAVRADTPKPVNGADMKPAQTPPARVLEEFEE